MEGAWIPQAPLGAEPPADQENPGRASPELETSLEVPPDIQGLSVTDTSMTST